MFKVKLRHLRIASRKVRLIADLVRGKSVEEAQAILNFVIKRGARDILNLLKSAVASAKNNSRVERPNLYIKKIFVDEGVKYKRWMPRARGQATPIQKKTSHVSLILEEVGEPQPTKELPKEVKEEIKNKEGDKEIKPKFKKLLKETPRPKAGGRGTKIFRRQTF